MSILINPQSDLRSLDADLTKFGNDDFIRVMHEPESSDRLSRSLDYLIENWPTSEDIQRFRQYISNSQGGGMRVDDSDMLKRIVSISDSNLFADYKSGEQTIKDKATLFINLYSHRPNSSRLYEWYRQAEEVKSIAEAIFKIKLSS